MSHEIMQYDNMVSVHEEPWHGLGVVLPDYIPALEVQHVAGLDWTAEKRNLFTVDREGQPVMVGDRYAIVRSDNDYPIGVVGDVYEVFQNDDLFKFMDGFCNETGSQIETAGSLRNGRIVWALATAGMTEYVHDDPVKKYFLFKNGFDGGSAIEICFTNVRVVCNNTLSMALQGATNMWRVRHSAAMHRQVEVAKQAVLMEKRSSDAMAEIMKKLAATQLTESTMEKITANFIARDLRSLESSPELMDIKLERKHDTKVLEQILDLQATGAGSDIPGVQGTAYGLLNAATEYADHYKTVRRTDGRSAEEVKFESIFMGGSAWFKTKAFTCLQNYALAA